MRVMQDAADRAYSKAIRLYESGILKGRLSKAEAIGTYIDNVVRRNLRNVYDKYDLKNKSNQVRVNRREYDSSKPEKSYKRPDARIGKIAYDVTLSIKTAKDRQIRGFFDADFRPYHVIIIRPRQLGTGSSYIINRPEDGK